MKTNVCRNIKLMNCKYTTEKNNMDANELVNGKIKNLKNNDAEILKIMSDHIKEQQKLIDTIKKYNKNPNDDYKDTALYFLLGFMCFTIMFK
jgi:hypothetical protein